MEFYFKVKGEKMHLYRESLLRALKDGKGLLRRKLLGIGMF